jgi:hypothetical protein
MACMPRPCALLEGGTAQSWECANPSPCFRSLAPACTAPSTRFAESTRVKYSQPRSFQSVRMSHREIKQREAVPVPMSHYSKEWFPTSATSIVEASPMQSSALGSIDRRTPRPPVCRPPPARLRGSGGGGQAWRRSKGRPRGGGGGGGGRVGGHHAHHAAGGAVPGTPAAREHCGVSGAWQRGATAGGREGVERGAARGRGRVGPAGGIWRGRDGAARAGGVLMGC